MAMRRILSAAEADVLRAALRAIATGAARGAKARALALQAQEPLVREVHRDPPDGRQRFLDLRVAGTVLTVLQDETCTLFPWDVIRCRLGTAMMAIRCLDNRTAVWPSGRRKGCMRHLECKGCEIGKRYAERAPWHEPPKPSQPAEVLSPEQRAAKARQLLEDVDDQPWTDPLTDAASMTPDDGTPF